MIPYIAHDEIVPMRASGNKVTLGFPDTVKYYRQATSIPRTNALRPYLGKFHLVISSLIAIYNHVASVGAGCRDIEGNPKYIEHQKSGISIIARSAEWPTQSNRDHGKLMLFHGE